MKDILERLKDVDYRVRKEAVLSLKLDGSEEEISLLIEALGDENLNVANEAINALKVQGDTVIPHMIKALKHTSWTVRRNAAGVLVGLGNSFLGLLLDLARTNDDDIQFWICEVISRFGSKAVKTLKEVLEGDDMPKRLCALNALGKTGVREAVLPLIHCLADPHWTIRKTAAEALIALGATCAEEVIKLVNCGTPDLEFWAIQILGEIGGDISRRCLINKTCDDKTTLDQKQILIQALRSFDSSEVIPPLVQMLGDDHWIIRKHAAEALWDLGDQSEDELGRALKSKNSNIRYWAARVLGDLQATNHVNALAEMMKSDSTWSVRAAAAQALGEIGEESVTLDLIDVLRDSSEYVRKNAMIALNKLGEIKDAKRDITDEWVQDYTREVFSNLKSKRTRSMLQRIKDLVVDVPDYPKPGIVFKDICPLLSSPNGLSDCTKLFELALKGLKVDVIAGIESRGFIFGATLAQSLKVGFVPIRKKGKLPGKTICESYDLEYGNATIEVQEGCFQGLNVVLVDDILATGGTAKAAVRLIEESGGNMVSVLFLMELDFLCGIKKLNNYRVHALLHA